MNENHLGEFVQLLTAHQEALRLFVHSLLPNHPDIMDLVQEVNITLWEKREQFEMGTNFGAWARQMARNKVMNHQKKLKRAGFMVFDEALLVQMETEMEQPLPEEVERKRQALATCFGRLTPDNQSLVSARYSSPEQMYQKRAASGRTAESLRVTLFRLRSWLRKCVDQQLAREGGMG